MKLVATVLQSVRPFALQVESAEHKSKFAALYEVFFTYAQTNNFKVSPLLVVSIVRNRFRSYINFNVNLSAWTYYKSAFLYIYLKVVNLPQDGFMIELQKCTSDFL